MSGVVNEWQVLNITSDLPRIICKITLTNVDIMNFAVKVDIDDVRVYRTFNVRIMSRYS